MQVLVDKGINDALKLLDEYFFRLDRYPLNIHQERVSLPNHKRGESAVKLEMEYPYLYLSLVTPTQVQGYSNCGPIQCT